MSSAISGILVPPSTLLMGCTLLGLLLLRTSFARSGRRLALIAGSALAICALSPLCVVLIRPLEDRFVALSIDQIDNPTGIIALGGSLNAPITRARGPIALGTSGARATEAIALAYRFPKARLVFSGGSGEGDVALNLISQLRIPMNRVTIEGDSRTTFENAAFTRRSVEPKAGEQWILVTSASHMPRASAAFTKAGFNVVPYPVDYTTLGDSRDYWNYSLAPLVALPLIDRAVKEWVGLTVYWITGRTAQLFPRGDEQHAAIRAGMRRASAARTHAVGIT